jgi:epoxyqueuosine reductase
MDARRCITYLTIEHEGEIPEDLRPLMGASLFGCDRCTAVCPYNRAGDDAVLPEFNPVGTTKQRCLNFARHDTPKRSFRAKRGISLAAPPMPTAEQCLTLSEADFQQRFRGTAVYRSGLARLKRNAEIAISNRGITHSQ